jgi:hypothetical protein
MFFLNKEYLFLSQIHMYCCSNPDCLVHVENEAFICHHLVLESYSVYFDREHVKEIELPVVELINTRYTGRRLL